MRALVAVALLSCGAQAQDWTVLPGASGQCSAQGVTCPPEPTIPWVYRYDADTLGLASGALVSSWPSTGSDTSPASSSAIGPTYTPVYEVDAIGANNAVSYDGVADVSEIQGSQAGASFLTATQQFHVVSVMRTDTTQYGAWLASTATGSDRGVLLDVNSPVASACVYLLRGGAANFSSCPITALVAGAWTTIEISANGTTMTGTKNWVTTSSTAITGSVVAGNATNRLAIGATAPVQQYPFDGAVAWIAVANRPLTGQERIDLRAHLECRFGVF